MTRKLRLVFGSRDGQRAAGGDGRGQPGLLAGPGQARSPLPPVSQPSQRRPPPPRRGAKTARRSDEGLPGAVELSDGNVIAGYIHTTRDQPWTVYVEGEKRWRLLPPLVVLSIRAWWMEESIEPEWRWAGMGRPERVYTGRQYPFRRYRWTFRLIDGSEVVGTVKGQPFWVVAATGAGPAPTSSTSGTTGQPGRRWSSSSTSSGWSSPAGRCSRLQANRPAGPASHSR